MHTCTCYAVFTVTAFPDVPARVVALFQVGFVIKKDLQKKKNDDEVEEGWVQCDCCDNWVHMICGLFNKGRNDQNVHYLCPYCLRTVSNSLLCDWFDRAVVLVSCTAVQARKRRP